MAAAGTYRMITESFGLSGGGTYNRGDLLRIPPGVKLPRTLETYSEPYGGHVPPEVAEFDPVAYELSQRRDYTSKDIPKPPTDIPIDAVCARYGWTVKQLSLAHGGLGFPVNFGTKHALSSIVGRHGDPLTEQRSVAYWRESQLTIWEQSLKDCGMAPPKGGGR